MEEEDRDRQEEEEEVESGEASQGERAMMMTTDGDMKVLRPWAMSVRCVSSTETVNNARYVQTQCMCATQSSKSTSSLVYLLCMVSCLLLCASFQLLFVMTL